MWLLPSITMTAAAREGFWLLDRFERIALYELIFASVISGIHFFGIEGPQPLRLDEAFWERLVRDCFTVNGTRLDAFLAPHKELIEQARPRARSFREALESMNMFMIGGLNSAFEHAS